MEPLEKRSLPALCAGLKELNLLNSPSLEEQLQSINFAGSFNQASVGLTKYSGSTHWECHPSGDELLYVIEGETLVTITDWQEEIFSQLTQGDLLIVPAGKWHKQQADKSVTLLFITPVEGTEIR